MSAIVVTREVFVRPASLIALTDLPTHWDEAERLVAAAAEQIRAKVDAEIIESLRRFQRDAE